MVPSSGPATVPSPPINANMAISMAVASENSVAGSRNVMYMAWKVPTSAVSAAEIAIATSFTRVAVHARRERGIVSLAYRGELIAEPRIADHQGHCEA